MEFIIFYIKAVLFIVLEVGIWYMAGTFTLHCLKQNTQPVVHRIITGFISYHVTFFIVAVPMKATQRPLSWLSVGFAVCIGILGIWFVRRIIVERTYKTWRERHWEASAVVSVAVLLLMMGITVYVAWANGTVGSAWDDSYYIGDVSASVYTNTISTYDPYTGVKLESFHTDYFLETLENHSAVISQIFGVHPILVVKYIQAGLTGVMYYLILYAAGMVLGRKNYKIAAVFPVVGAFVLLFSYSWLTASGFYFQRSGEGKTLQALVLIPLFFYLLLRIAYGTKEKAEWVLLFLLFCASFGLNMSSLFIMPVLLGAGTLSLTIAKRDWRILRNGCICLLPCLVVGVIYIAMTRGILVIPIR